MIKYMQNKSRPTIFVLVGRGKVISDGYVKIAEIYQIFELCAQ